LSNIYTPNLTLRENVAAITTNKKERQAIVLAFISISPIDIASRGAEELAPSKSTFNIKRKLNPD